MNFLFKAIAETFCLTVYNICTFQIQYTIFQLRKSTLTQKSRDMKQFSSTIYE